MLEISISKIEKDYGFGKILSDISFEVMNKEIVALIGENGSGKSTLLKIIAKKERQTNGMVAIRKTSTIGYLEQIISEEDNILVKDILYRSVKNITDLENRLRQYEEKMLKLIAEYGILDKSGVIVVESDKRKDVVENIQGLRLNDKRTYGRVVIRLYELEE